MTLLSNSVVLITGAGGGFGQELTRQLLVMGSRLILTDINQATLQNKAAEMQKAAAQSAKNSEEPKGNILACLEADLASKEGCDRLYFEVQSLCQTLDIQIDVLINNAGIAMYGRMDEVPSDQWERLMQINLLSPMRLSSYFAADMIARRQGHIVNISSIAGWLSPPGLAHYSASKFGLRGFSEGLCNELAPHNVKVTVVCPYFSRTPILDSARYGTLAQTKEKDLANQATDPADVMRETIQAIQQNQLYVFPDAIAKTIQLLKRLFPKISTWMTSRLS